MTQQITILLATLEKIVGALDDADDYLADCDIPEDRKVRANINMALTAGRAALEGAERVEPVAWLFTNVQSGDIEASTNPDWNEGEREMWSRTSLYTAAPAPQP